MRNTKAGLLIAIGVIVLGYVVAFGILPRLGLRIGFEGGMVLQASITFMGIVIAGFICAIVSFKGVRVLRRHPEERRVSAYVLLVANMGIALTGLGLFCYLTVETAKIFLH